MFKPDKEKIPIAFKCLRHLDIQDIISEQQGRLYNRVDSGIMFGFES